MVRQQMMLRLLRTPVVDREEINEGGIHDVDLVRTKMNGA
jgi:hypothetical protein